MTGEQLGAEAAGRPGPCVECKANRARMINLAHDVMTLRATVERIEAGRAPWEWPDAQEITEWALIGIGAALLVSSFIGSRRG